MSQGVSISHLQMPQSVVTGSSLSAVQALYDSARYLDAYEASLPLGPLQSWKSSAGRLLAGRLASNLGAPRLGRALQWLAAREFPEDAECIYYAAINYCRRFGAVYTWNKYRDYDPPCSASARLRADWLAFKATILASLRDFSRANVFIEQAFQLDAENPWILVEKGSVLAEQDRRVDALQFAFRALEISPTYRPAIQFAGYCLTQLRRDDEAIELLKNGAIALQSGDVWCQLALLQRELNQFEAAWDSLTQVEKHWPLAASDSHHRRWLTMCRSDVAYARGDLQQALDLIRSATDPQTVEYAQRLQSAIDTPAVVPHRVQLPVPFIHQNHLTCAPASLAAIAQYWDRNVKHEEIVERICYQGTESSDERYWAESNNFFVREFRATESVVGDLVRKGIPLALCTVDTGSAHLQVIVGIDDVRKTFLVQDPSERHLKEMSIDPCLKHYASGGPRVMLMIPMDQQQKIDGIDLPEDDLYDDLYGVRRALKCHQRTEVELIIKSMELRAPDHRLTLDAKMDLALYDSNQSQELDLCERMLALHPENINMRLFQVSLLGDLGRGEQRLGILRSASREKFVPPALWTRLASELTSDARNYGEAERVLRRPLRYPQIDGRALWLHGHLLWHREKRADALEYYRLAACVDETDEWHARSYFVASRYLHQSEVALNWLEDRYRQFAKKSSAPGQTLAWAYHQLEQTQRAFDTLDSTVELHPKDGNLRCSVAMQLGGYNRHSQAAEHLELSREHVKQTTYLRTAGRLARMQGKSVEARDHFSNVLQLEPLDTDTLEEVLGLDQELEGNDVAETRLRQSIAAHPHSYSLRIVLIQWLRANRFAAASDEIDRFVAEHPSDAWAFREKAVVALISNDCNAAKQAAEIAIELEPSSEAYMIKGQALKGLQAVAEAKTAFREAIRRSVDNESAIALLIASCERPCERLEQLDYIYEQLNAQTTFGSGLMAFHQAAEGTIEPHGLLNKLKEALTHRPDLWHCYSVVIKQYVSMSQNDQAVDLATDATQRFPLIPGAWLDLALVYRAMNDTVNEIAALQRAREINPTWSEVTGELSATFARLNKYDDVEKLLTQALAVNPQDGWLLGCLADCQHNLDKKDAALDTARKCCLQNLSYDWAWSALKYWSGQADAGKTARSVSEQVIERHPHDVRAYVRSSEVLESLNDIDTALVVSERGLRVNPRSISAHKQHARCLARLHRWDEAIAACKPPVFGDEVPFDLQLHSANLMHLRGKVREAVKTLQQALEIDSDNSSGWEQLAKWSDDAGLLTVYQTSAENLVRIAPYQPVPRGYLADAILRQHGDRSAAIGHLETALRWSPSYNYATLRLVELYLEDNKTDDATRVLDFSREHLTSDQLQGQRLRVLARLAGSDEVQRKIAIVTLVEWCRATEQTGWGEIVRAVDTFDRRLASAACHQLADEIKQSPQCVALGTALGRLVTWSVGEREMIKILKSLPTDSAWYECMAILIPSIPDKQFPVESLYKVQRKFAKQIRANTRTWTAMGNALLGYSKTVETVQWSNGWRKHTDAKAADLLWAAAANFDSNSSNAGRAIVRHALSLPRESTTHCHHVLAGIDALIQGDLKLAAEHARAIDENELTGWYNAGYCILIAGCQLLPSDEAKQSVGIGKLLKQFHSECAGPLASHAKDKFTLWVIWRIRASLADAHSHRFRAMIERLKATFIYYA